MSQTKNMQNQAILGQWRSGVLFPVLVAMFTLGLGGSVQFLMWGGAVSENLKQLDQRLAMLDERLEQLYPRSEAVVMNAVFHRDLMELDKKFQALNGRVQHLETAASKLQRKKSSE